MKINIQRILCMTFAVFIMAPLAVPAFAYPQFPLPNDPAEYYYFDYVPDLGDGTFACDQKIPYGFYQPYLPVGESDPDGPLILPPIHFSSSSYVDLGDGITGDGGTIYSEWTAFGFTYLIRYEIINLDNPVMGYNSGLATLVTGDGLTDSYISNSLGLYLVPLSSTDQVPNLSPSDYFEFVREDNQKLLEGSFVAPPGNYYAILYSGEDVYFTDTFIFDPVLKGAGLADQEVYLDIYYHFDDVGLLLDNRYFSFVTREEVSFASVMVHDGQTSVAFDRVLLVPVETDYDIAFEYWDYLIRIIQLYFARYRLFFFSDNGLTLAGFLVVGFFAFGVCVALIVLIRRALGFGS